MRAQLRFRPRKAFGRLVGLVLVHAAIFAVPTRAQIVGTIDDRPVGSGRLQLVQSTRIGSLDRESDAFARVSFVALRAGGFVVVADDQMRFISLFDPAGRLVARTGRQGQGPGEYESPWLVAVARGDSVLVWDMGLSRVSVLAPDLHYVRSFGVPPSWVINSLRELPSGRLLIAAFDGGSKQGLHVLSRSGQIERSFADIEVPPGIVRYHASLLGGYAAVVGNRIVFTRKSPYRIEVFDFDGRLLSTCVGDASATTPPASVIEQAGTATRLHWNRFVHSTAILPLGGDTVLNLIVDRTSDRHRVDIVALDGCRLVARRDLPAPVFLNDSRAGRVSGFMELEFPEVVIYTLDVSAPSARSR